ncbi:MAG: hypothetical protein V5A84_04985 [Planctomycetota bacterium]
MAWRIHRNLIDGEMDNTTPGRVTGTLRFVGKGGSVTLDLEGDFSGCLKGERLRLKNPDAGEHNEALSRRDSYMRGFDRHQEGEVEAIEPIDPSGGEDACWLHAAWYSDNGRVVLELPAEAWEIVEDVTD